MLAAIKRNQKGLTLIELLAVLVIVGIIAAIAVPAIGGTITKAKTNADAASVLQIEEAAKRYLIDQTTATSSPPTSISYSTLISEGYLTKAVTFSDGKNVVAIGVNTAAGVSTVSVTRTAT